MRRCPVCWSTTISRVALYFFGEAFDDLVPVKNTIAETTATTPRRITIFNPENPGRPFFGDFLPLCGLRISFPPSVNVFLVQQFWGHCGMHLHRGFFSGPNL